MGGACSSDSKMESGGSATKNEDLPAIDTKGKDPYEKFESFGHHNNAMLQRFLDSYGFEYEFQSSTDWYTSGRFDPSLKLVLQHYDEIMAMVNEKLGIGRTSGRESAKTRASYFKQCGIVVSLDSFWW